MNNLLERLHASFFFYLLTTPTTFLKIGLYLPAPILIGVALLFGVLQLRVRAGWRQVAQDDKKRGDNVLEMKDRSTPEQRETRSRPVLEALSGLCTLVVVFRGCVHWYDLSPTHVCVLH